MPEQIDLTAPEPAVTSYKLRGFEAWKRPWRLGILLESNTGETIRAEYHGLKAKDIILGINTGNFTVNSLEKRLMQKLLNDPPLELALDGAITGAADEALTDRENVELNGIEVIAVGDLAAFLATEDSLAQVQAWKEEDTRVTADVHYDARIAELQPSL